MTNKGVTIRYGDVAPEAKENFVPTSIGSAFDTLSQLQRYNLNFPNYANPCELYQTVLDGTATALPSDTENANVGFWSKQISDDEGNFETPIELTLESEGNYSSSGFTFTFDRYNQIYPTHLNIRWYKGDEELSAMDIYPDNAIYSCQNRVELFNKVVITFYSLNMPQNRLKLRVVDYGYGTVFNSNNLRSVKLIQEIDPVSTQISINTADFTLDTSGEAEYYFQNKQPLSIYFNGKLKATTFIKNTTRKSKAIWNIQSEDYIGLLDSVPYYGGIYKEERAIDILEDIFTVSQVPFSIESDFNNKTVTGYIPYTTCRDALMQVAFAIQAAIDTSNSDLVKVFAIQEDVTQTIPLSRIMQGQSFSDEETVTAVEVTAHTYKKITETIDVYDADESGTGQNVFVQFSEPLHSLKIGMINEEGQFVEDSSVGEILENGANYAVINANAGCILRGQKYEHTTQTRREKNLLARANEKEKIVSVQNATLVSQHNIDNVIEKCYNYFVKTRTVKFKIVDGKHIELGEIHKYGEAKYGSIKYGERHKSVITYDTPTSVGQVIETDTEYLGKLQGTILKQTFNLNGGIIIKDTILK